LAAESDMIKLLAMGIQACLNISQAFPIRKLGEGKAEELIITGKPSDAMVAVVSFDAFVEFITRQMIPYLGKNGSLGIY
jgi:hypothetical protein